MSGIVSVVFVYKFCLFVARLLSNYTVVDKAVVRLFVWSEGVKCLKCVGEC